MRPVTRLLTCISACVVLGGCATTALDDPDAEFHRGLNELDTGRTDAGFNRLLACAQGGHPGCMGSLGELLASGKGTVPDPREALRWQKYAFSTGLDGGFAGIFGALSAARYYCNMKEVAGTYADVALWTDRAAQLNKRLMVEHPLGASTAHSKTRTDIRSELTQLRESIQARTCGAASG